MDLSHIRTWLLDMDGTLFLGERLLPGARALIDWLVDHNRDYLVLTNNSSRAAADYAAKLARLGLPIPVERVFTSGQATALYLQEQGIGPAIYLVGTPPLEAEFERHGFTLTADAPAAVVLSFDTTLTYDKLRRLCDFVRAGLPYIATHPDLNCPVEGGFIPDIGAMIAFVEASTGRRPDVIVGKPHPPIVQAVTRRTGTPVEHIAMIGDRLYTDIALGATGITTILTLTGETHRADLASASQSPDVIVEDLTELLSLLDAPHGNES